MTSQLTFFATAAKGIETLLAEELNDLGLAGVKESRSGVSFTGDLESAYRACLWSRIANRVLLPVGKFAARSSDDLYDGVGKIDWAEHMNVDQTLAIDASVANSEITHSKFAALRVKDAIADQFRDKTGERPSVDTERPDLQINVYINNNEVQIYIDLSGDSLHVRGYRTRGSAAPLKETLAAAILYRAKWPEIAKSGGSLVDFMCGSGTLPIEAAMMACDIAPGIDREYYGLLGWKQHDAEVWKQLKSEANQRRAEGLKLAPRIYGFDHHEPTLERTRQHVTQAGLNNIVSIGYQDVFEFDQKIKGPGLVVLNPPYGVRLGHDEDLEPLYNAIGFVLKNYFAGWKATVFTDDKAKGKAIGIRANKIHSLYNGALPCKLLHFDIVESEIFKNYRLPKFLSGEELSEQSAGFRNRLTKNLNKMKRWGVKENVTCFRIYDADLPDYSVAIDLYFAAESSNKAAPKCWVNIQEYEAPKTIDPDKARHRLREVVTIANEVLQVDDNNMFLKSRRKQKGDSQYEKLASENNFFIVNEEDCQFYVNFEDYLDTGLFLDHRPVRKKIRTISADKSVLNLFAYTGSISVHAAMGGAGSTLTIDMSKTYLDWARRNMELNGFKEDSHRYKQADCLTWLENPNEKKLFDIIFLDPPSFSNSKRMQQSFDVQKDHCLLVQRSMDLLEEDGVLFFSNNLRGFKLDLEGLAAFQLTDITEASVPADFKQRKHIHRCWEIRHRSVRQ